MLTNFGKSIKVCELKGTKIPSLTREIDVNELVAQGRGKSLFIWSDNAG